MSDEGHGSGSGDHHHEAFDAEPAHELSPGEPESPLWLPVVGLALFVAAGLWWSMGEDENAASSGAGSATAAATAPAPVARPAPAPAARGPRPNVAPRGTAAPGPPRVEAKKLDPAAIEKLRDRLREAREKGTP